MTLFDPDLTAAVKDCGFWLVSTGGSLTVLYGLLRESDNFITDQGYDEKGRFKSIWSPHIDMVGSYTISRSRCFDEVWICYHLRCDFRYLIFQFQFWYGGDHLNFNFKVISFLRFDFGSVDVRSIFIIFPNAILMMVTQDLCLLDKFDSCYDPVFISVKEFHINFLSVMVTRSFCLVCVMEHDNGYGFGTSMIRGHCSPCFAMGDDVLYDNFCITFESEIFRECSIRGVLSFLYIIKRNLLDWCGNGIAGAIVFDQGIEFFITKGQCFLFAGKVWNNVTLDMHIVCMIFSKVWTELQGLFIPVNVNAVIFMILTFLVGEGFQQTRVNQSYYLALYFLIARDTLCLSIFNWVHYWIIMYHQITVCPKYCFDPNSGTTAGFYWRGNKVGLTHYWKGSGKVCFINKKDSFILVYGGEHIWASKEPGVYGRDKLDCARFLGGVLFPFSISSMSISFVVLFFISWYCTLLVSLVTKAFIFELIIYEMPLYSVKGFLHRFILFQWVGIMASNWMECMGIIRAPMLLWYAALCSYYFGYYLCWVRLLSEDGINGVFSIFNMISHSDHPWQLYSRTVIIKSFIDDLVDRAGWLEWYGDFAIETFYYGEFMNEGPDSNMTNRIKRPGFKHIEITVEAIQFSIGPFIEGDKWFDPYRKIFSLMGLSYLSLYLNMSLARRVSSEPLNRDQLSKFHGFLGSKVKVLQESLKHNNNGMRLMSILSRIFSYGPWLYFNGFNLFFKIIMQEVYWIWNSKLDKQREFFGINFFRISLNPYILAHWSTTKYFL